MFLQPVTIRFTSERVADVVKVKCWSVPLTAIMHGTTVNSSAHIHDLGHVSRCAVLPCER